MTTETQLETGLRAAFQVEPSADVRRILDARVGSAIDARRHRRATLGWLRVGRPALGVVVALVVVTTAVAGYGLIERIALRDMPIAWTRGTPIDLSQTSGGTTVRLVRAYADTNRTVLAISVVTDPGSRYGLHVELVDAAGQEVMSLGSQGRTEGTEDATLVEFAPVGSRPQPLTLRFTAAVPGVPLGISFRVPDSGGTVVEGPSVERDGITVGATRFAVSPSMVVASLVVRGVPVDVAPGTTWAVVGTVAHAGWTLPIDVARNPVVTVDGVLSIDAEVWLTLATAADQGGMWILTIDELVLPGADGSQVRIAGPWRLEILLP